MAKVIGPLFSQEARGQFGKALVFSRRRGQNIVRGYVVPANPQTALQVANRIIFAVAGIVTRRTSVGRWTHAGLTQNFVEFWTGRVQTGEVWNSAYVREMLGPNNANYNAAQTIYAALTMTEVDDWESEATTTAGGLVGYTRGTVTISPGFMLFLAQTANSVAGYQTLADNGVPVTLISDPA